MDKMYITQKGLEYFAQTARGKILHFTKGKFGDGEYTGDESVSELTDLVNPLGDMPISKQTANGTLATITTQFSNKVNGKILNAFNLKEIGLYAKVHNADGTADIERPETLVAYAYAQGLDAGDRIEGVLTEFTYNWNCTISDTSNVTVELGSMVYVSRSEYEIDMADKQIKEFVITGTDIDGELTLNVKYDELKNAIKEQRTIVLCNSGEISTAKQIVTAANMEAENMILIEWVTTSGRHAYIITPDDTVLPYMDNVPFVEIVNNLYSHDTDTALSANQGRILDEKKADISVSDGGFVGGSGASTASGGAVGRNAYASYGGGAVGENAHAYGDGGAVGKDARTGAGFAGGKEAKTVDESNIPIDAIQLGTGINPNEKTLQVYGFQLMDKDGNIPVERLKNVPEGVEVVDSLTSTDPTKALSAKQGNLLKEDINSLSDMVLQKVNKVDKHGLIKIQDNAGSATVTLISSLSDGEVGENDTKDVEIPKLERMLSVEDALSALQTRITYSTDDLTAGESPLADGTIYFVYE